MYDKALDINKDGFSNGGIDIETPGQNLVRDPRTKTLANGMQPNVIPTGDEVEVKGTKRMLKLTKRKQLLGINMWLSAIKLAVSAGSKIYANKQKNKDGNVRCTTVCMQKKWPKVRKQYQGKLLEARQSDWKDEAVL